LKYRVVFDAGQALPPWYFPAFGLIFITIGLFLWRFRTRPWPGRLDWPLREKKIAALALLVFSVLWTSVAAISVFGDHARMKNALLTGTARVVEGNVEDFHPMPHSGHDTERLTVNGVHFAYSDFILTGGFNQTSSHGGPMRAGLAVRIHYEGPPNDATILRLEIAE